MHILFLSTELAPSTNGGAGVVVARLRHRLMAAGHTVSVILVASEVGESLAGVTLAATDADAQIRSSLAADAVTTFVAKNDIDLIEIQDFDGLAFSTLADRDTVGVERVPIQIRFHGTADLMFESIGAEPAELAAIRSMERSGLEMADRVIVPSSAIARLVTDRYSIDHDRLLVSPPPLPPEESSWSPSVEPTFVAVGRLGEVKGTHDLIAAAVPVLRQHPSSQLILVGEDGWSASTHQYMSEWLQSDLVGEDVRTQVNWLGRLEGDELRSVVSRAWAFVVASRFESFHLGLHEARRLGVPAIVPTLPAFSGTIGEPTGALTFDGSRDGLTRAMESIVSDTALRDRLASAPAPSFGDPLVSYAYLPKSRHPRAQAGLATIAVKELASVTGVDFQVPSSEPRSRMRRIGAGVLAGLPDGIARAVVAKAPQEWIRSKAFVADWVISQQEATQRATQQERLRASTELMRRIDRGEFRDLDEPVVSVIIPVHNDAEFIDDAIESVFFQTEPSFEIVVVNDGSTAAGTVKILDELSWPRTTVISQSNRGLAAARNAGVAASRGRFVVPLDVDDALEPRFLEAQLNVLGRDETIPYTTTWTRLTGDIEAVWIPRSFNEYQILLSNSNVGCVLLRRSAFDAVGGYNERMRSGNEDWDLWVRLLDAGSSPVEVPEVLFRYRKHGITMSVHTEARYETARREMVEAHPKLYERSALAERKRGAYPALSIVVPSTGLLSSMLQQTITDAEILLVGEPDSDVRRSIESRGWSLAAYDSVDSAVDAAIGKYITLWDPETSPGDRLLGDLTGVLEQTPSAGVATTSASSPLTVVRRWSLSDDEGPRVEISIDDTTAARSALGPGDRLDGQWQRPTMIDGLEVRRQRPEEDGFIPEWTAT